MNTALIKIKYHIILLLLLFSAEKIAAQQYNPDSLFAVTQSPVNDSILTKTYHHLANYYIRKNIDSANKYLSLGRKLSRSQKLMKALSNNYSLTGNLNYWNGNTDTAEYYYSKAMEVDVLIRDSINIVEDHIHISRIYSSKGDIDKATDHLSKGLEIAKKTGEKEKEADCLFTLAVLYDRQDEPEKAIKFCENALELQKEIKDSAGMAFSLHRMGLAYESLKKYDEALKHLEHSLEIRKKIRAKSHYGPSLNGIGLVYLDKKEYGKALKYFYDAYKCWSEVNDKEGIVIATGNLGEISMQMGDEENAFKYFRESFEKADEIHSLNFQKGAARSLAKLYYKRGNYKQAYEFFNVYSNLRDTLFSDENAERIAQMQSKYESDQKEQTIKLLTKEAELQESEIGQKRLIINAVSAGAGLLTFLIIISYRNLKQKQKANFALKSAYSEIEQKNGRLMELFTELEQNRDEVAGKNKEITDSIKYAKHLQEAILPDKDLISSMFPDSFVLYKPKDIVSGDFYWFEKWGNKKLFAAVDCTGHGVPGAFMSIVGYNQLNQAVNEHGLYKPNLILNALNKGITKALRQTMESSTVKDGMDMSLCSIDETTNILEYAGAYNSLWLLSDGVLTEVKADKRPIGVFLGEELIPFKNNEIQLKKGDTIYIYTDGYADQFGGEKGKKFKYKSLQQLLMVNQSLSMADQKKLLEKTIDDWRGNLEQVDDILVIGVRV